MPVEAKRSIVKLDEGKQGQWIETSDYFFHRIGDGVPIKLADSKYHPDDVPAQPLAVSQRHTLIFIADNQGFLFARTRNVISAAKEIKENGCCKSFQDFSIAEIELSDINILALSANSSTLGVCCASFLHFFSVDSLLNMEKNPFLSVEVESINDMKWNSSSENSYIVLSGDGRLFHGIVGQKIECVMNDVESFDWSLKGDMVAIAKYNNLAIFAPDFTERISIELSGKAIRVDSIKWVRPDCIVLGYIQKEEGEETNYRVEVISSKNGDFSSPSPETVVICFDELFSSFGDDIVPYGVGPSMCTSYLKNYELAIASNRNNTDQHIVLLGWLSETNNEVAVVDVTRDDFLPRIELQEDGEENVVLALYVDNVSIHEKVKVQLDVDEWRELLPFCVLICLTLEGKIVVFHVSSLNKGPPLNVLSVSAEEPKATNDPVQQAKLCLQVEDESLKHPSCEDIGNIQSSSGVSISLCNVSSVKVVNNMEECSLSIRASGPSSHSSVSTEFSSLGSTVKMPSNSGKLRITKDTPRLSSQSVPHRNFRKSFGNVQEMVRELDDMLKSIEEPGGFMDMSTTMQKESFNSIEENLESISEKCRIWSSRLENQLTEIQHLYDGTAQILVQKAYVRDGLRKAADTRYRDLCNQQKLNPEFQLKKQHIIETHQQLISQLVSLERHFNAIELNKFSMDSGNVGGSGFHFRVPGHVQSLHSLQGIMSSQLDTAERHSKLLSKQMALLKIESPPKELKARKELLQNMGLTSSDTSLLKGVESFDLMASNKVSYSLESSNAKSRLREKHPSREPESVRRRRDSLDKSWIQLNPPKTTVKRISLDSRERTTKPPILLNACGNMTGVEKFETALSKHSEAHLPETCSSTETVSLATTSRATQHSEISMPLSSTLSKPVLSMAIATRSVPVSAETEVSVHSVALRKPKSQSWKEGYSVSANSLNNPQVDTVSQSTAISSMTTTSLSQSNEDRSMPAATLPLPLPVQAPASTSAVSSTAADLLPSTSLSSSLSASKASEDSNLKLSVALSSSMLSSSSSSSISFVGGAERPLIPFTTSSTTMRLDGIKPSPVATSEATNEPFVNRTTEVSEMQPSPVTSIVSTEGKAENLDNATAQEDEMEEEASETIQLPGLSLGSLGDFGLGSASNIISSKPNPFGGSAFPSTTVTSASSPFSLSVPSGELFRPASVVPSQASQPSHGFGIGSAFGQPSQIGYGSGFAQPAQIGPGGGFGQPAQIGPGQHALGSVLGAFGQSRQIGAAAASNGFANVSSSGGFTGLASSGGGFAGLASSGGGFASLASSGGGFAGLASSGGGFAAFASSGSGFGGNPPAVGGGFGSFASQGFGGFSAFGGSSGAGRPPAELFTQMRK